MPYRFWNWQNADCEPTAENCPFVDAQDMYDHLKRAWCVETCAPRLRPKWSLANMTEGQCSITAFLAQDYFGGDVYGVRLPDGAYHCYNVVDGKAFDLTSEQFGDEVLDYSTGVPQSREAHLGDPDKRARYELLKERLLSSVKGVHLRKICWDNVRQVCRLGLTKEQTHYVANNKASLICAYITLSEGEPVLPYAIYHDDKVVGFIMLGYDDDWTGYERKKWLESDYYKEHEGHPYYYVWRFMIDRRYQRRGYGREALELALDLMRTEPYGPAEYAILSYEPSNEVGRKLYASLGFEELTEFQEEDDEVYAVRKL